MCIANNPVSGSGSAAKFPTYADIRGTFLKAYLHWAMRFRQFIRERMPAEVSADDAKAFLTYLAVERAVSASTQNQAFNALLFLFTKVLGLEYSGMAAI